jgi:hypothetical protein
MEIVIALDSYDDLFSDFDIRGYGERALSRDFLDELRVRLRKYWMEPDLRIVFLVPATARSAADEELVVGRVRRFIRERSAHYLKADRSAKLRSLLFVAIGAALSVGANLAAPRFPVLPLLEDFLLIPSWFFVWSGFDLLLQKRGEISGRRRYYAALSEAAFDFRDSEK